MFTLHYKPRKISEIDFKTDTRVAVVGKIIKARENSFVLDDGSGRKEISFDKSVEENKIVRAFCSLAGEELKADIVQSLNGLDLNLFKRVEELYRKAKLNV